MKMLRVSYALAIPEEVTEAEAEAIAINRIINTRI